MSDDTRFRFFGLPLVSADSIDDLDWYPATGNTPHYVYALFDDDMRWLYVGMTFNPNYRLRQHRITKRWWASVSWVGVAPIGDEVATRNTEKNLIRQFQPSKNVRYASN